MKVRKLILKDLPFLFLCSLNFHSALFSMKTQENYLLSDCTLFVQEKLNQFKYHGYLPH